MTAVVCRKAVGGLAALLILAAPASALAEGLSISLPRAVKVHKAFRVTVRGDGSAQDTLNVYLDHRSCARHGFDEDARSGIKQIVLTAGFHGHFARTAGVGPARAGPGRCSSARI